MKTLWKKLQRYVSPVFLVLLGASYIMWCIAKLSYTYSTTQDVRLDIDGVPLRITALVEGVGSNLFIYRLNTRKTHRLHLDDLKYSKVVNAEGEPRIQLDPISLQKALVPIFSDIKIISLDDIPDIEEPQRR